MRNSLIRIVLMCAVVSSAAFIGCDKEEDPLNPNTGGTGLFKTAGTFSFSSNRGNFSANGIFDTLMISQNAAGAFSYSEHNMHFVVVFAYDMTSQTNMKVVYAGMVDSVAIAAGNYSFNPSSTSAKNGFFVYMPNLADTSLANSLFMLINGAVNVSAVSSSAVSGSFSGTGFSVYDTTNAITVSNGSFNTPIVEKYFGYDTGNEAVVVEKIKADIRRRMIR